MDQEGVEVVSARRRRQVDIAGALPKLEIGRREPFAAQVAKSLLDLVFSGKLSPGERLPSERQLAESLGVGRTSVREAVRSLEVLDLIDVRHGGGTYLKRPDTQLFPRMIEWSLLLEELRTDDLLETRLLLEAQTSRLAAVRRTSEDVAVLHSLVERMQAAQTPAAFVQIDVEFHDTVARASKNSVLASVHHTISSLLHAWLSNGDADDALSDLARSRGEAVFRAFQRRDEHVPVLEAIEAQDALLAEASMAAHMRAANTRISEVLSEHRRSTTPEADNPAPRME